MGTNTDELTLRRFAVCILQIFPALALTGLYGALAGTLLQMVPVTYHGRVALGVAGYVLVWLAAYVLTVRMVRCFPIVPWRPAEIVNRFVLVFTSSRIAQWICIALVAVRLGYYYTYVFDSGVSTMAALARCAFISMIPCVPIGLIALATLRPRAVDESTKPTGHTSIGKETA